MPVRRNTCGLDLINATLLPRRRARLRPLIFLMLLSFAGREITFAFQQSRPQQPEDDSRARAIEAAEYVASFSRSVPSAEGRITILAALGQTFWAIDRSRAIEFFNAVVAIPKQVSPAPASRFSAWDPKARAEWSLLSDRVQTELMRRLLGLDPQLYEKLIRPIRESKELESSSGPEGTAFLDWNQIYALLETDPSLAATLAERRLSLGTLTRYIEFLVELRAFDSDRANGLFREALSFVLARRPSDLNPLVTLSSYLALNPLDITAPIDTPTVQLYLQALFGVLTYVPANHSANGIEAETTGPLMRHLTIVQSLPIFEQYLPEAIPRLEQMLRAFAGTGSGDEQTKLDHLNTTRPLADSVSSLLAQVQSIEAGGNRDASYSQAAIQSAARGEFERARQIARQIDSEQLRQKILDDLVLLAARSSVQAGEFEQARTYAQQIREVFDRSELLDQLARRLIELKKSDLALSVLSDALTLIKQQEPSTKQVRMLARLIRTLFETKPAQAYETVQSLVVALNRLEGKSTAHRNPTPVRGREQDRRAPTLIIERLFEQLGSADFNQSLYFATQIENTEVRALTELASCRAVLGRTRRAITSKPFTESLR